MDSPSLLHLPSQWQERLSLFGKQTDYVLIEDEKDWQQIPQKDWPIFPASDHLLARIPAEDNGDKLIDLESFLADHRSQIFCTYGEAPYGSAVNTKAMLRKGAAERLLKAEQTLQALIGPEWTLKVTDTLRPIALQKQYFASLKKLYAEKEGLEGDALYAKVTKLLMDPDLFPAHASGGAVDLTIAHIATKKELPMGTALDEANDPRIFTFSKDLSAEEQKHRLLLFCAMTDAGFANFPGEWWHYGYGERDWALRTASPVAIYDVIDDDA